MELEVDSQDPGVLAAELTRKLGRASGFLKIRSTSALNHRFYAKACRCFTILDAGVKQKVTTNDIVLPMVAVTVAMITAAFAFLHLLVPLATGRSEGACVAAAAARSG